MKRFALLALSVSVTTPLVAQAGGATRVLIVSGLSGDPSFARTFNTAAGAVYQAAHDRWHVADSDLVYLNEDPTTAAHSTGKSTRENVAAAFTQLAAREHAGDVVLVLLIGHGAGEGAASALNLPGPDPTAGDYATWVARLAPATVVFVDASSASGDFVPVLAGPNRIVITATKTAFERNAVEFAGFFANGLASGDADADKDGVVTVAEAFHYAVSRVAQSYDATKRMLTEHAVIADSSHLASATGFGGRASSADPRVTALLGQRRAIQLQVDSLHRLKPTMDSTAYQSALETLLLQLAERTRALQALQGAKP
ncbi:MAG TPA: hypothetical protein VGM77_12960 [Gemmatimonadales bacterium]|jgi:hypothetical protein